MILKVFCIAIFVQYGFCNGLEDFEFVAPMDSSTDEYEYNDNYSDNSSVEPLYEEIDAENFTVTDTPESEELSDDEEPPEEAQIFNFAGPVQAKGTVSVAANFGYDSPFMCPSISITSNLYPHYHPPLYPPFLAPLPYSYSHMPQLSMFLQGIGSSELSEFAIENLPKIDKEVYLEITPLVDSDEFLPVASESESADGTDTDEMSVGNDERPVTLPVADDDGDFPNNGVTFGGILPASGTVTIAARF